MPTKHERRRCPHCGEYKRISEKELDLVYNGKLHNDYGQVVDSKIESFRNDPHNESICVACHGTS